MAKLFRSDDFSPTHIFWLVRVKRLVMSDVISGDGPKGFSIRANVLVSANDPEVIVKLKITLRQGKIRLARIRHSPV